MYECTSSDSLETSCTFAFSSVIIYYSDSAALLVFADHDVAAWAVVLDCLEAVHEEGEAEAGPEAGEAERGGDCPGEEAGPGGGHHYYYYYN